MYKFTLFLVAILGYSNYSISQELEDIFIGVDTLFMPGAALGHLSPNNSEVIPLVSSSACNIPQLNYAVATEYGNGKVIAIAHESLLSDNSMNEADNVFFLFNAIHWLSPNGGHASLKTGWITGINSSLLEANLIAEGYTFSTINSNITNESLMNTDLLILGNDWNGTQPYNSEELMLVDAFVANGGALLIAGLGWSWPQSLDIYPMNQIASLFGFEYTTDIISDPDANENGYPKLYNFYPDNLDTEQSPYCPSPFLGTNIARGEELRILRLAVSTNGEFTQQMGGEEATMQALVPWLEEINEIYGREYCVRFELIENNDLVIFADPTTDPWPTLPPGSGGCTNAGLILNQQFNVFNNTIGTANYDISHVIVGSPFGGGCASSLETGVSGGLDIPVTRHEIGHQFTQSHTINNNGNNNYETENGAWTIQGGNAQGHAHAVSYHQLADFLLNGIPDIGVKVSTGNNIPTVDAGPDVAIPFGTPFTLTGSASDPDPEDELTYVWDNMNRGIAQSIPVADDSQGALFMRLLPDTSPSRTFPRMSDVLANNDANEQEQLPTQSRIMDIRLTVNDNHQIMYEGELVNASGANSDDIQITVADAGPFTVTSQNVTDSIHYTTEEIEVTWDVNGTNSPPVNTQNVSISLSLDGGLTYPIVLLENTPNTGNATVTLPDNETTLAGRIKVAAVDNIYFDVNPEPFIIEPNISNIQELNGVQVLVYPNPTKTYFQIDFSAPLAFQAEVYDAKGRLLIKAVNENRVDVSSLQGGVYFVVLTDLNSYETITRSVIITE